MSNEQEVFHRVGSLEAMRAGGDRLVVTVAGKGIVVLDVPGGLVAVQSACPHNGGPICEGELSGETLSCPWHGYNYNVRSGACEDDSALRLDRYEVRVDGDDVLVRV